MFIVLMAVVNANYCFIGISDGGILSKSNLGKALESGNLNLPEDEPLPEAPELGPLPYFFGGR